MLPSAPAILIVVRPGPEIEAAEGPLANALAGSARARRTMSASFFTYWAYTVPGALVPGSIAARPLELGGRGEAVEEGAALAGDGEDYAEEVLDRAGALETAR